MDSWRGCCAAWAVADVTAETEEFCVEDDDVDMLLLRSSVPDASFIVSNLLLSVLVIVISSLVESRLEK